MKVVVIRQSGGTDVLQMTDAADPEPGAEEVRVRVHAAGLNRADILQRKGLYPAPAGVPADIPGLEFSGTVDQVGDGVERWRKGDRVMGIVGGGACAEYLVTRADALIPVPASLSLSACAAIPEAFMTAYDALVLQGGLCEGQTVLIHAAGSGVGTAAVQLARVHEAIALGTSRSLEKLEKLRPLGLSTGLDGNSDWASGVLEVTDGRGAEMVLDLVGGAYLEGNLRAVAECGRIVVVGLVGGSKASLSLGRLLARRITLIGTVLRSRSPEEKARLAGVFERVLVPLFESGDLQAVVHRVMPMSAVADAHQVMEENRTFGKVVLAWDDELEHTE